MLALWVCVHHSIWPLLMSHAPVAFAVAVFAVLKTLALTLMELELLSSVLLLLGLNALTFLLRRAPTHTALKLTAVSHCVVRLLNAMLVTVEDRIPLLLLAQLALAQVPFAAQELCAHLPIVVPVLSMFRNQISRQFPALAQLALTKTAVAINARTSIVMRASRSSPAHSLALVSHAPMLSAVTNKLNALLTTCAIKTLVMC